MNKEYIRRTTKKVIQPNMFDKVYKNFTEVLKYPTDNKMFSGVEESVITNLDILSNGGRLERKESIDIYQALNHAFEPYVKKLLFIVEPDKYRELSKSKNNSLLNYLNAVGYPVFVDSNKRNAVSDMIFHAYEYRNDNSHECSEFTEADIAVRTETILCGYLLVAQKRNKDLCMKFGEYVKFLYEKDSLFDMELFQKYDVRKIVRTLESGGTFDESITKLKKSVQCHYYEKKHTTILYYSPDGCFEKQEEYDENDNLVYETDKESSYYDDGLKKIDYLYDDSGRIIGAKYYCYFAPSNNELYAYDTFTFEKSDDRIIIYWQTDDVEVPGINIPKRVHPKCEYAIFDEYGRPLYVRGKNIHIMKMVGSFPRKTNESIFSMNMMDMR